MKGARGRGRNERKLVGILQNERKKSDKKHIHRTNGQIPNEHSAYLNLLLRRFGLCRCFDLEYGHISFKAYQHFHWWIFAFGILSYRQCACVCTCVSVCIVYNIPYRWIHICRTTENFLLHIHNYHVHIHTHIHVYWIGCRYVLMAVYIGACALPKKNF